MNRAWHDSTLWFSFAGDCHFCVVFFFSLDASCISASALLAISPNPPGGRQVIMHIIEHRKPFTPSACASHSPEDSCTRGPFSALHGSQGREKRWGAGGWHSPTRWWLGVAAGWGKRAGRWVRLASSQCGQQQAVGSWLLSPIIWTLTNNQASLDPLSHQHQRRAEFSL